MMNQETNEQTTGLSGFLAPDGVWYPCGYNEHGRLARELCEKYERNEFLGVYDQNVLAMKSDFIKFGLDREGIGHFFYNRTLPQTEVQIQWLRENTHRMTIDQRDGVEGMFHRMKRKNKGGVK